MRFIANPTKHSIIYDIGVAPMADEIKKALREKDYSIKLENHVTVVPPETGRALGEPGFQKVAKFLLDAEIKLPRVKYGKPLYMISDPKFENGVMYQRQAIVAPIASLDIEQLLDEAAEFAGVVIPHPFQYATLATAPNTLVASQGIEIMHQQEWDELRPRPYFQADWLAYNASYSE